MNRSMLLRHLAEAERRVRKGAVLLKRQRSRVERRYAGERSETPLEREVWHLLSTMELIQASHVAHRDLIRRELAELT